MKKMPLISVIIPAYNVEQWLPRCLDSVLSQTYTNLEIIVINDGSSDGTGNVIDEYAGKDSRVVAVHQKNAGLIAVRETGIALAKGAYVGFVDGDDSIEPDMYARLLENALKNDADISQCGILYCFYDGRKKPMHGTGKLTVYQKTDGLRALLQGSEMEPSLCNKLYRRELMADSCLDTSVVNNEDLLRNFTLFNRADRSVFEDFCGYQYWRRAESMSNISFRGQVYRDILRARTIILEHAAENIRDAAMQSYMNALISSYNAAIGIRTAEAAQLRGHCKAELKRLKASCCALPRGLALRAAAILTVPGLYHSLFRLHTAQIQRKIKAASAKVYKQ